MKRAIFVTVMALIFFFVYQFLNSTEKQQNPVVAKSSKIESKKAFLDKRSPTPKLVRVAENSSSQACLAILNHLEEIDFNQPVSEWIGRIKISSLDQCQDEKFSAKMKDVKASCLNEAVNDLCLTHLVLLRSLIRTQGISDSDEKEMLVDLVLAAFTQSEPDFKSMSSRAEKLMQLDPHNEMFQKIWASSKMIGGLQDKHPFNYYREDILSHVYDEIWEDQQMEVIRMALETNLEPLSVESYARESRNDELLGWALWKQGRKEEAMSALNRAIANNPKDEYLREQRSRLQKNPNDPQGYMGRFTLGFNFQDIFN